MNDIRIQTKKVLRSFFIVILIIIFTILVLFLMNKFKLINKKYYTARDFNIKTIYSNIDYDHDNLDDYSDFVLGARKDAENHPKYKLHPEDYKNITSRDSNIDFRRVHNLRVFFKKYSISLTLDYNKIAEWQPGDIVIFGNNKHIGIISDRRNEKGIPYVIHNGGQVEREQNYLSKDEITGHYRFDASLIPDEVLIAWHE